MKTHGLGREERQAAARLLSERLTSADIRSILKQTFAVPHHNKGVERIVAETENDGQLLRTRIEDSRLPEFLVDVSGADLLDGRIIRKLLALRASDSELDALHDFPGVDRARGTSAESLARCVAERSWRPGKRWAQHFASVLGFPHIFAGLPGSPSGPDAEDVQPHVPLKPLEDFQEDLRIQICGVLTAAPGQNRAVMTLPTGAGKTRTTVEALLDWWMSQRAAEFILWVAQSEELCEQAVQAFREVWVDRGDRGVRDALRIYRFWGNRSTLPEESGVIIATIDKLRKALVDPTDEDRKEGLLRISSEFGVVIIDEAHRAEAPSYRKVLHEIGLDFTPTSHSAVPLLGLTATPLRSQQEETLRLSRRFYNCLLRPRDLPQDPAASLSELRERGVLSRPTHRLLPPTGRRVRLSPEQEQYFQEWNELPSALLAELGQEKDRNRQLLDTIIGLNAEWPVLFFGCSVQHAEAMAVLLRRRGREAAAITADTREATRRHLIEAFRRGEIKVLCNYGVLTTGFDAPTIRAVIIGRPTASRVLYEQMIGRGMRGPRFGGTDECLVVDVDDNLVHMDGNMLTLASQQYAEYWLPEGA